MSKFVANRIKRNVEKFYQEIKSNSQIRLSNSLVERVSSSGDTTGTPFYHFRWKFVNLADYVVYPESHEDVITLLKLANKYKVSITPRGSGSCYYGSGIPTNGGAVMDLKRMHKYSIDKDSQTVTVEPGMVFSHLMKILEEEGFELGCYPTSAYTTTIGGWAGTGGSMGIGTLQNGSFINQIKRMKLVNPLGNEKILSDKKDMEKYFGTNGIYGVITEFDLIIYPNSKNKVALEYGFDSRKDLLACVEELVNDTDPFELRFCDKGHEFRSTGFSKYEYYIFLIYNGRHKPIEEDIGKCKNIMNKYKGIYLGDTYSENVWDDFLKHEMRIKLDNPVLMLQQILIKQESVPIILDEFNDRIDSLLLNSAFYGIINRDFKVRLVLYTPTDNEYWMHFLSSKATLHEIVKKAYKLGGRVYTYGLQNSIYLHKFEKEKLENLRELKNKEDPHSILNPLKVVETKISFSRIDVMFGLILLWRKIAIKMGKAEQILLPKYPGKH